MGVASAIDGLTKPQKIQLMEAIWDDLCREEAEIESPAWHEQILANRQARVDRGEAQFTDWQTAKKRIRDAIR